MSEDELRGGCSASGRAGDLFRSGFYCAESVLLAISEQMGIKSELIPRMASGFCSGVSRTCGMCGALSGAILALGLRYGRSTPDGDLEPIYAKVQLLLARFRERFGTTNCRELIGCDLNTSEGQRFFMEHDCETKCREITQEAARIAASLIDVA
ncbi:MAG: C-GCAxxG-C-C family protein [Acidobacteriota bacterium]